MNDRGRRSPVDWKIFHRRDTEDAETCVSKENLWELCASAVKSGLYFGCIVKGGNRVPWTIAVTTTFRL
jgi:hypothetical protein